MAENEISSTASMFYRATGKIEPLVVGELYRFTNWNFNVYNERPTPEKAVPVGRMIIGEVFTLVEVAKDCGLVHLRILSKEFLGWVRLTTNDQEYLERVTELNA